jgi:hypothetical protein
MDKVQKSSDSNRSALPYNEDWLLIHLNLPRV